MDPEPEVSRSAVRVRDNWGGQGESGVGSGRCLDPPFAEKVPGPLFLGPDDGGGRLLQRGVWKDRLLLCLSFVGTKAWSDFWGQRSSVSYTTTFPSSEIRSEEQRFNPEVLVSLPACHLPTVSVLPLGSKDLAEDGLEGRNVGDSCRRGHAGLRGPWVPPTKRLRKGRLNKIKTRFVS